MKVDSQLPTEDISMPMWLLVINPISGGRRKADMTEKIIQFLKVHHIRTHAFFLTGFQDSGHIRHWINSLAPDRVVAIGGDGTANLVAQCIRQTNIPMGIIPAGSANGLALDLGIPRDLDQALEVLIRGQDKPLDMLVLNDKFYSLHLSDAGLNANLIWRFEQSGQRGSWSYFKEMIRGLVRINSFAVRLYCNGKHYRSRAVMLAFANGSRYGSGAVLNPGGQPDDGKFEVCLIRSVKWYRIPALAWHLFRGNVHATPELKTWSTDYAYIRLKRKVLLQADGEILGHHNHIEVKVEHDALRCRR